MINGFTNNNFHSISSCCTDNNSMFTGRENEGDWYNCIKNKGTLPNFIMPIMWEICYIFFTLSIGIIALNPYHYNHPRSRILLMLLLISLVFNILWSYLYFNVKELVASFIIIVILLIIISFAIIYAPSNLIRLFLTHIYYGFYILRY